MGGLLSGGAPLRGRAGLELIVSTFNFRLATDFWGIRDHRLAALVYFVLGGTPAYWTEYLRGAAPADLEDFDAWVIEHVLNPASPLFREVRALLAEDPTLRDTGLYHTVLAAVAEGNATRGGIANRIERMCRLWSEDMAEPGTSNGIAARVLSGVVHDKQARIGHEVDVAVFDPDGKLLGRRAAALPYLEVYSNSCRHGRSAEPQRLAA